VDTCARRAQQSGEPFTAPKFRDGKAAWSFSGLKTAVKMRIAAQPGLESPGQDHPRVQALCRSLQETIAKWLLKPIPDFARETGAVSLIVSGGVACNSELRHQAKVIAERQNLSLAIPEPRFCTDNGAMIAAAGALLPVAQDLLPVNADADLKL